MKKALMNMFMVLLLVAVVVTAGCIESNDNDNDNKDDNEPIHPTDSAFNEGMNEFVNSSNEFTFQMYEQLIDSDKNVFFSPYSISIALGMAYEGTKGKTTTEMAQVLDFPADAQARIGMVMSLQSQLNKDGTSYELSTANAYWLREDGKLKDEYKNIIESYYLAFGQQLDFVGDPEGSVDTINAWIKQNTNDKIKDLLSTSDIDPLTYLILTNAIYFKSDWKYQFNESATEEMSFYNSKSGEVKTDMMHMCDESKKLNYASNSDVQLLQLPYKNEELSMFIMLPKENEITSFEPKLDHTYLKDLKDEMTAQYVDLYLPKFKFEQKYKLKDKLISMGMPTAFGKGADFSGITSENELYIDEVIHQSFVEVNEEGTEAAAATAVVIKTIGVGSSSPPTPIEFKADHPFIFIIQHKETGQILFMGKVVDPSV